MLAVSHLSIMIFFALQLKRFCVSFNSQCSLCHCRFKVFRKEVIKSQNQLFKPKLKLNPGSVFENNFCFPGSFSSDAGVDPAVGYVKALLPGAALSQLWAHFSAGQQRGHRSGHLRCEAEWSHRSGGGWGWRITALLQG